MNDQKAKKVMPVKKLSKGQVLAGVVKHFKKRKMERASKDLLDI